MALQLGPRATQLLSAWGLVALDNPTGPHYDLTHPTRSERCRTRIDAFIEEPNESTFEDLWTPESVAVASEWHAATVRNLWSGTFDDLAELFAEIRAADQYAQHWRDQINWGLAAAELYTRTHPEEDLPIVSDEVRRGLQKFGIEPETSYLQLHDQLSAFRDRYLDIAGHVTASSSDPIPVVEEMDQLFHLVTTATTDAIAAESTGPRGKLYGALRGYPGPPGGDRGPIEIDFTAAAPAIDGHIAARQADAYADTETEHWAGTHYETWKWDFASYVTGEVAETYSVDDLAPSELEPFFDAFWANADEYTDTDTLSTPVPQYLLGRWGVVQLGDFQTQCLDHSEEAAEVLSFLFSTDEHLVERLERFHKFAEIDDVSDGNLLRIATTFLMGAYPDKYVNFQYQRFDTFFSDCSNTESLNMGFDARQYYRIVLACRDLRDVMREDLPDASMLDVHTLIRLYQDYLDR